MDTIDLISRCGNCKSYPYSWLSRKRLCGAQGTVRSSTPACHKFRDAGRGGDALAVQLIVSDMKQRVDRLGKRLSHALELARSRAIEKEMRLSPQFERGSIYVIEHAHLVKIGFTTNVNQRMASFRAMSPVRLKIVGCMPGTIRDEKNLHREFAHYREVGEWFRLPEEAKKRLLSMLTTSGNKHHQHESGLVYRI